MRQQLDDLAMRIDRLRSRGRNLKGPPRVTLMNNIQLLQGKLNRARSLWRAIGHSAPEDWQKLKKKLDATVVKLNKSYNYLANTLREN